MEQKEKPDIWKEFINHLKGSHHTLLRLIDKHTDMIHKLEKRIDKLEKRNKSLSTLPKAKELNNDFKAHKSSPKDCLFCKGTGKLTITLLDGTITEGRCPQCYKGNPS